MSVIYFQESSLGRGIKTNKLATNFGIISLKIVVIYRAYIASLLILCFVFSFQQVE